MVTNAYRKSALIYSKAKCWFTECCCIRTSANNAFRSGWRQEAATTENIAKIGEILLDVSKIKLNQP